MGDGVGDGLGAGAGAGGGILITGAGACSTPKDGMPDGGGAGAGIGAGAGGAAQATIPNKSITDINPITNLFIRASLSATFHYIITLME